MGKGVEPSNRTDIAYIIVRYTNGDEETLSSSGFSGSIKKFVNHDAGNKRDRQEWDCVDITLSGPKRPVNSPDAES